jgi:hypothetical protein
MMTTKYWLDCMKSCCEAQEEQFGIQNGDLEGVENDEMEDPAVTGVTTDMDCEKYKKCCCEDDDDNNGGGGPIPFNPDDPPPPPDPPVEFDNGNWIFLPVPVPNDSSEEEEEEEEQEEEDHAEHPDDDDDPFDPPDDEMEDPSDGDKETPDGGELEDPSNVEEPEGDDTLSDLDDDVIIDGSDPPIGPDEDDDGDQLMPDGDKETPGGDDDDEPIEGPIEEDEPIEGPIEEDDPCKTYGPDGECECYVGDPECDSDAEGYQSPIEDPIEDPTQVPLPIEPEEDLIIPVLSGPNDPFDPDPIEIDEDEIEDDPIVPDPIEPEEDLIVPLPIEPDDPPPEEDPPEDDPPPEDECMEDSNRAREIWVMVNQFRVSNGLRPLQWDDRIAQAAKVLAKNNYTSGTAQHDFNGKARLLTAGYDVSSLRGEPYENVHLIPDGTPAEIVLGETGWVQDMHKDIMLGGSGPVYTLNPTRAGVAYVCGSAVWMAVPAPDDERSDSPRDDPTTPLPDVTDTPMEVLKQLMPSDIVETMPEPQNLPIEMPPSDNPTPIEFLGNPTEGSRVVIVGDKSWSMHSSGFTKYARMQLAILETIAALDPTARLKIYLFNDTHVSSPWFSAANWAAARTWLLAQPVGGTTNSTSALQDSLSAVTAADAAYFLTDGDWKTPQVSSIVNIYNQNNIPINTTSFALDAQAKLSEIATSTGGSFKYVP